jgi:hypothetical protein
MKYCDCHKRLSIKQAFIHLFEEIVEFIQEPSKDEWSDVKYCLNRLLGSIFNKEVIKLFNTSIHDAKIQQRMKKYGCIRSERHKRKHQ